MSYLTRLKAEFSGKALPSEPTKPTKAHSVSFVSPLSRRIPVIVKGGRDAEAKPDIPPDDATHDPAMEARRQKVLNMLAENPGVRYAVLTDTQSDPEAVLLTLAIRGQATCELRIPRDRYDPFALLALIERHGATVH